MSIQKRKNRPWKCTTDILLILLVFLAQKTEHTVNNKHYTDSDEEPVEQEPFACDKQSADNYSDDRCYHCKEFLLVYSFDKVYYAFYYYKNTQNEKHELNYQPAANDNNCADNTVYDSWGEVIANDADDTLNDKYNANDGHKPADKACLEDAEESADHYVENSIQKGVVDFVWFCHCLFSFV